MQFLKSHYFEYLNYCASINFGGLVYREEIYKCCPMNKLA